MNSLELVALRDFPLIEPYDNLAEIIFKCIKNNNIVGIQGVDTRS